VTALHWIVAAVAAQRLLELVFARRNEAHLRRLGGVEVGARHYPLIVLVHALWLAALPVLVPSDTRPDLSLFGLYLLLQAGRYWVIATLGRRWTTRVIVLPGEPPVTRGPYRYVRHPNYLIVAAEIALLPFVFGAWQIALVFSILNAAMLAVRIRAEDAALYRGATS
jgi:methyltransferase